MRAHATFARVSDFAEQANRMPHVADHLARLFRDSGYWHELQGWYVTYTKRWRARLPWSIGQYGTMFPSGAAVESQLVETFADLLGTSGTSLPLLSVAAQRVAAWRPTEARVLLRELAGSESHPLSRRTLALAALHAGEVATVIRGMLQQHEENALVLAMLEDVGFKKKAVPLATDFSG
jgi:hypothetical protein